MTDLYFVVFISHALPGVVVGLVINGSLKSFRISVTSVLVIKMDEVLKESLCIENAFVFGNVSGKIYPTMFEQENFKKFHFQKFLSNCSQEIIKYNKLVQKACVQHL